MRVHHEKKCDGVRAHHEKKSDGCSEVVLGKNVLPTGRKHQTWNTSSLQYGKQIYSGCHVIRSSLGGA